MTRAHFAPLGAGLWSCTRGRITAVAPSWREAWALVVAVGGAGEGW